MPIVLRWEEFLVSPPVLEGYKTVRSVVLVAAWTHIRHFLKVRALAACWFLDWFLNSLICLRSFIRPFTDVFSVRGRQSPQLLRGASLWAAPKTRTKTFCLPQDVRRAADVDIFKQKLETVYLVGTSGGVFCNSVASIFIIKSILFYYLTVDHFDVFYSILHLYPFTNFSCDRYTYVLSFSSMLYSSTAV